MKLRGAEGKRILRRSQRGRLPAFILDREKRGFSTPTAPWLRGTMAPLCREALLGPGSLCAARVSRTEVERLLEEHGRGGVDRTSELWSLLGLELWHRAMVGVPLAGTESTRTIAHVS